MQFLTGQTEYDEKLELSLIRNEKEPDWDSCFTPYVEKEGVPPYERLVTAGLLGRNSNASSDCIPGETPA